MTREDDYTLYEQLSTRHPTYNDNVPRSAIPGPRGGPKPLEAASRSYSSAWPVLTAVADSKALLHNGPTAPASETASGWPMLGSSLGDASNAAMIPRYL